MSRKSKNVEQKKSKAKSKPAASISIKPASSFTSPLPVSKLRHICNPKVFKFESTKKLPALTELIGQERATDALLFGLGIRDHGYHLYALGPMGTGKATAIRKYLEKEAKIKSTPPDWLYVNNFDDTNTPKKMQLPAGKGKEFRDDMKQLVTALRTEVPKAFETENYEKERGNIEKEFNKKSEDLFQKLAKKADERGFRLIQTAQGFAVLPVVDENVAAPGKETKLTEAEQQEIQTKQTELVNEVHEVMRKFEQLQKEGRERMLELDKRVIWFSITHMIDTLKDKYRSFKEIITFLTTVHENLLKNVQAFKQLKQAESLSAQERLLMMTGAEPLFEEYLVNLIVDNSKCEGAPVIFEKNPTGPNLIGRIEQQGWMGTLVTNFRMIKAGALHKANGGYLILDILDVLKKPLSWEMLKRTLKNEEIIVESMTEALGAFTTRTLDPEPIPLNLKVVLIGNPYFYYLIYEYDPEFKELFKVKVDFAEHMPWDEKTVRQYAQFVSMVCNEEKLTHFTPGGVAKIVEYGARISEHQNKITTKFGAIVDIIRQSCYWADKNKSQLVTAKDVQKTLDEKIYRSNRIEELIRDMIAEKTIKISTKDSVVGQINGISVLSLGDYSFGKPSRITAKTYVGNSGLVNIEREIELGGRIHNKAAMIVSGYLGGKYAQNIPMVLTASITFEQVYEEVEGDSASAAEIYVLLSSLSGLPIRQDLATTGSVNQHGEIQAIGGVNEKIEGFFKVCKIHGLTGKQGVIIPENNAQHLMLHEEVVDAVKSGQFHIYSIANIDEGIELLTGKPAGKKAADGTYPKGSVNGAVQQQILTFAEKAKTFGVKKTKQKHRSKKGKS